MVKQMVVYFFHNFSFIRVTTVKAVGRCEKVQKLAQIGFLGNRNVRKKTSKLKLLLITTTTCFLLQDFHKVKKIHKLLNFVEITQKFPFLLLFLLQDSLKVNAFQKNNYTCKNKYLSTLFCCVFVRIFWHSQKNSANDICVICHFLHIWL